MGGSSFFLFARSTIGADACAGGISSVRRFGRRRNEEVVVRSANVMGLVLLRMLDMKRLVRRRFLGDELLFSSAV